MENTSSRISERIIARHHLEDAVHVISDVLSRSDLTSLLMDVYQRRAARIKPANLVEQIQNDRFVQPSPVPQQMYATFDHTAFALLPNWESIELAPLAPLGTCSALGPVDQKLIVGSSRGQELMSDCTNVLAMLASVRRRELISDGHKQQVVRLCTSHRLTRTPALQDPLHTAHFRVFTLLTAGRDLGNFHFEQHALAEHITFYLALVQQLMGPVPVTMHVRLSEFAETGVDWHQTLEQFVSQHVTVDVERLNRAGWTYYSPVHFRIAVTIGDATRELIDGGFVDWTQSMLSDRKERTLISAIGAEMFCKLMMAAH